MFYLTGEGVTDRSAAARKDPRPAGEPEDATAEMAGKKQSGATSHMRHTGQRIKGNDIGEKHRSGGAAGTWAPSCARDSAAREKVSLAAMFDRLAKAAAAHDGDTAAGTFGEMS